MDIADRYRKKAKKISKRLKCLKSLYRNRGKLGKVVYSVLYLASGKGK